MVVIRVISVPVATESVRMLVAVHTVKPDDVDAAVAEEVAAAATEGDPVATKAMEATKAVATEAMATTSEPMAAASMASTATATTSAASVGDLGQRDDHGDQQGKHQIEQLTIHDTHSFCRRSSPSTFAINVLG
jgi:hypothetical protein